MTVSRRLSNLWMAIRAPFLLLWLLWKVAPLVLVVAGLKKPRPRVRDLRFPILMIGPGGRTPVVETSPEGLRKNPLAVSKGDKTLLIDVDFQIYAQSNVHQPYNDIAELWRIATASDRVPAFKFDLHRRRSGLVAAREHVLACPAYADPVGEASHKRAAVAAQTTLAGMIDVIKAV